MKRFIALTLVWLIAVTFMLFATAPRIFADSNDPSSAAKPFSDFIGNLISILKYLAMSLAVFFLIWGAVKLKASQGNPASQQQAKLTIAMAVGGFILALFSQDIITAIKSATGK
jgi:hypothetical protein